MHYLPLQEVALHESGPWDEIPGLYLPTRILDLCYSITLDPPTDVLAGIALLAWVPIQEVKEYYSKVTRQMDETIKQDEEKERWKKHELYCKHTKVQLESLCRRLKIPVTPSVNKHQLVSLISEKKNENYSQLKKPLYSGKLMAVPNTVTSLNKLTAGKLRVILRHHGCSMLGSKDQHSIKGALATTRKHGCNVN